MIRRRKFFVVQIIALVVSYILCTIQAGFNTGSFSPITPSTPIILACLFFAIFQLFFFWKEQLWRKIANILAVFGKMFFCIGLLPLITWIFHESHWTAEHWAQIGNFGANIWYCLFSIATSLVVYAFLFVDLVLVGVDVVWMVKKLAKHIQAKKQKA